ncbi:protease B nonderepressible form [Aspergillus nanangensis]|uniref:Protein PBN1 n=1 Tax=Aspergillus nanangensis TaxID=2582783 RepID=A0AAD4GUT6_ASPNN|nr:protease B nonderepressible form [Aspergillus nanangensis]
MRRRITFVQASDAPFAADQASLTPSTLSIRGLDAAREERATFSFDEIPSELGQVLQQCHQLHIRWAREEPYDAVAPFSSRVSPGLHVFFTPPEEAVRTGMSIPGGVRESVCSLLKRVFDEGIKCESPQHKTSFITPPILSTRFASTAAFQYHSSLPALENFVTYLQHTTCASADEGCLQHAASILSADSVDINYDSISHALTVSGYWSHAPRSGWTEEIHKHAGGTDQVEVGLLGTEKTTEPEEVKMGGLLGVVGKDVELKPTLFSFPARHHPLPDDATYSVSFPAPTGLHPTMTISLPRASLEAPPAPPDATCALHTYLTLPSTIFGDKYQLSTADPLFLSSHNLVALRAVSGETDLEAPDWVVPRWGSNWLVELATPQQSEQAPHEWNVTIPLHMRYLEPSESGYRSAAVPWPVVFWACTAEDGTKMGINPFDRVNLGWEGLFGTRTMFYQLHPAPKSQEEPHRLVEKIDVPVLKLEGEGIFQGKVIEVGTVTVILLGLVWVLWKLGLAARSPGPRKDNKRAKTE